MIQGGIDPPRVSGTVSLTLKAQFALIHQSDSQLVDASDSHAGGQASSSEEHRLSRGKGVPGPAKAVIFFQTILIIFLVFWVYQEFLYNQYLQAYVNSYLQGSGLLVVILGSIGVFVLVGTALYLKLRRTRGILETAGSVKGGRKEDASTTKILEPHVEQHLIEMMRRTTPADGSNVQGMPVLHQEDPQPSSNQQQ